MTMAIETLRTVPRASMLGCSAQSAGSIWGAGRGLDLRSHYQHARRGRNRYIHESRGMVLVVTDDDILGTFTFLRALRDHGNDPDLTLEQIGKT
jgi:hypothetical protein